MARIGLALFLIVLIILGDIVATGLSSRAPISTTLSSMVPTFSLTSPINDTGVLGSTVVSTITFPANWIGFRPGLLTVMHAFILMTVTTNVPNNGISCNAALTWSSSPNNGGHRAIYRFWMTRGNSTGFDASVVFAAGSFGAGGTVYLVAAVHNRFSDCQVSIVSSDQSPVIYIYVTATQ